jgi:hypothetical protein
MAGNAQATDSSKAKNIFFIIFPIKNWLDN